MKFDKFTDVCMTGGIRHIPSHTVFFLVLSTFLILTYLNFRPPFWRRDLLVLLSVWQKCRPWLLSVQDSYLLIGIMRHSLNRLM